MRLRSSARPGLRSALLVAAVVIVLYLLATAAALIVARDSINAGVADARLAGTQVRPALLRRSPAAVLVNVQKDVTLARTAFSRARIALFLFAPMLRHLSWIPRYGDELTAAPTIAELADETTQGVVVLLSGMHPMLARAGVGRTHHLALATVARQLAAGRPLFQQACDAFSAAQRSRQDLVSVHSSLITGPLQTVDRQLPRLQVLCHLLLLAPGLLGYPHPYTYLIAYQNPSELRAAGGFLGSFGFLTFHSGTVVQQFHGTGIKDNVSVPPPEPLLLYDREPGWLFRDSNWSPDFPTTAALERYFLKLDVHRSVSAVVNVTPQATADMLRVTGPLYSPEYHRQISSTNVARLADYYSHQTTDYGPLHFQNHDTQRKQFIQIVAKHLFARLTTLTPTELFRLANVLSGSINRRDIQINFQEPEKQALVDLAGASGRMSHETADYLCVVDSNIAYNKINPYVHLRTDYQVHIRADRWLRADLTLRYQDVPAPSYVYRDSYGPGAGREGGPADYGDFVRIYVPAGAQIISQSGWYQPWSPGPAYGKTMFSGYLVVLVGQTRTVHLQYVIPPNVFSSSRGERYHLLVQHQAGSYPTALHVVVDDGKRRVVDHQVNRPVTDWSITAPIAPRPFSPVPLIPQPAVVVAPGHWIEPHAFLGAPKPTG